MYKLRKQITIQNKTSTYTLWVTERAPYRPVRYEINGFNLLLNAPYDHYFIDTRACWVILCWNVGKTSFVEEW